MQGKVEITLAECYTVEPHEEKRLSPQEMKSGLNTDRLIVLESLGNKVNLFFNIIKHTKGNNKILWTCINKLIGKGQKKNEVTQFK